MIVIDKKPEQRTEGLTPEVDLYSVEQFLKREAKARSRIRCVRLVPLDTKEYESPAEASSSEDGLICRPSGQNGFVCEKSDTFPINDAIGWVLQGGVLSSSAVICVGVFLLLAHPANLASLLVFPHTPGEVWSGLLSLQAQAFIALGLLLLIATPVIRVGASIFAFAMEKDRRYVVITTIVMLILLTSFLLGKGAG